jgi:hypothetical protein
MVLVEILFMCKLIMMFTIIEGLVFVIPQDKRKKYKSGVIKHTWNAIEDIYFDVTQRRKCMELNIENFYISSY